MSTDAATTPSSAPLSVDASRLASNRASLAALGSIVMGIYAIGGALLTAHGIALLIAPLTSRSQALTPILGGAYVGGGLGLILTGFFLKALCIWLVDSQAVLESIHDNLHLITKRTLKLMGNDRDA